MLQIKSIALNSKWKNYRHDQHLFEHVSQLPVHCGLAVVVVAVRGRKSNVKNRNKKRNKNNKNDSNGKLPAPIRVLEVFFAFSLPLSFCYTFFVSDFIASVCKRSLFVVIISLFSVWLFLCVCLTLSLCGSLGRLSAGFSFSFSIYSFRFAFIPIICAGVCECVRARSPLFNFISRVLFYSFQNRCNSSHVTNRLKSLDLNSEACDFQIQY